MLAKDKIIAKLEAIPQKYQIIGNEIKTFCLNPHHDDSNPSYFINTDTLVSHCFSCGWSPSPRVLFDMDDEDVDEIIRNAKYNQIQNRFIDAKQDDKHFVLPPVAYPIDRDWRGLSRTLLERVGAYYCDTGRYSGRLVFPIYKNDKLLGLDARIVNPEIAKFQDAKWLRAKGMDATSIVYPYNYLKSLPYEKRRHLVLTEGVADALSYLQLGVASSPTFGTGDPDMERITTLLELGVDTITLGYDNDEAGQKAAMRVYKHYVKWFNIKPHWSTSLVRKSGHKDCNDYLQELVKTSGRIELKT